MAIDWSKGWQAFADERHRRYIGRELAWELSHFLDHPLAGRPFRLVGAKNRYDDFIVQLDDCRTYAYVRLTWRQQAPAYRLIGDEQSVSTFIGQGETG